MSARERQLRRALRPARRPDTPDFAATLAAAERRLMQEATLRRHAAGGAVLAACLLVAILVMKPAPRGTVSLDLDIEAALMTQTSWRAPSDSLLPSRRTDLYSDLPGLPASTDLEDRTLL